MERRKRGGGGGRWETTANTHVFIIACFFFVLADKKHTREAGTRKTSGRRLPLSLIIKENDCGVFFGSIHSK